MLEKIVLAVDGSPSSEEATRTAIGFAEKTGASVEVVHVREHNASVPKAGSGPDLPTGEEAEVLLSNVVHMLKEAWVTAHGSMRRSPTSRVAQESIAAADETGADLIVVGSRGLSSLSGMLLGSVSNKLVHLAGRPVLVLTTARTTPANRRPSTPADEWTEDGHREEPHHVPRLHAVRRGPYSTGCSIDSSWPLWRLIAARDGDACIEGGRSNEQH